MEGLVEGIYIYIYIYNVKIMLKNSVQTLV